MKKILITGASGFMGGHLLEEAVSRGYEVYAGVRQTSKLDNLKGLPVRTFPINLFKTENLHADLKAFANKNGGFEYVIHGAAVTKPKKLEDFMVGNAVFTEQFLNAINDTQPNFKKFIYLSSMAAQGPGDPNTLKPIQESDLPNPNVPYGKSKRAGEVHVEKRTIPYLVIRPIAVYGPGDAKFIGRVIDIIKKGFDVSLGSKKARSAFVHVHDVIRFTFDALESEIINDTFNISDGHYYNQSMLNEHLKVALKKKTISIRIPQTVMLAISYISMGFNSIAGKPTHLSPFKVKELTALNWNIDISKAQKMLDYQPKYDLKSGIEHTIENWK